MPVRFHKSSFDLSKAILLVSAVLYLPATACQKAPRRLLSTQEQARQLLTRYSWIYPRLSIPQAWKPCRTEAQLGRFSLPHCVELTAAKEATLALARSSRQLSFRKEDGASSILAAQAGLVAATLQISSPNSALKQVSGLADWALASRGARSEWWIDRSAIELTRALLEEDPQHLSVAFATARRAIELNPQRPEPFWNFALCLEALGLRGAARQAWMEAQVREPPHSPEQAEALRRAELLRRPALAPFWQISTFGSGRSAPLPEPSQLERLVMLFPQKAREWGQTVLLPGWGERFLAGDRAGTERWLLTAELTGVALRQHSSDSSLADAVSVLRRALRDGNPRVLQELARSHRQFGEAWEALHQAHPKQAQDLLEQASPILARQGSPLAPMAEALIGVCLSSQFHLPKALRHLTHLATSLEHSPYRSIRGWTYRQLGQVANNQDAPEQAISHLLRALQLFDPQADTGDVAFTEVLLGESYDSLGDREQAWRHFLRAAQLDFAVEDPYRHIQIANSLADFTLRQGDLALSFLYQDAAVDAALRFGSNPSFTADVLHWRALLNARLGRPAAAAADLAQAKRTGAEITDPERREQFVADFELISGAIALTPSAAASAIRPLTHAIARYERTRHGPNLLLAYEARAHAYRLCGKTQAEKADLVRSLHLYESLGQELENDALRPALSGVIESAFEQMVRSEIQEGKNRLAAVSWHERAKALSYPIRKDSGWATKPLPFATVARSLPPDTVLVEYALLSDRLLAWIGSGEQRTFHQVIVPQPAVERAVSDFNQAPWGSRVWLRASQDLYGWLFGGWLAAGSWTTLAVVPDKILFSIPWAALQESRSGRFLVEQKAVLISPSATFFARARQRDRQLASSAKTRSILVVTDPRFNPELHRTLEPLPASKREGERIQWFFPRETTLLTGTAATPEAFLHLLPGADLLHFAGHAFPSPNQPLQSTLVLAAPPRSRRDTVTGREIQGLAFPRLRLATLSACSTVSDPQARWPGAMSLARPFLMAGVPEVVGTLWHVDDSASERLIGWFYDFLWQGKPPPVALQLAQQQYLASLPDWRRRRDREWAAFTVVGGFSTEPFFQEKRSR